MMERDALVHITRLEYGTESKLALVAGLRRQIRIGTGSRRDGYKTKKKGSIVVTAELTNEFLTFDQRQWTTIVGSPRCTLGQRG
ncbi:hypothetical protein EVAR_95766_1 [Eumeta japonica]|uniref:Uncharacterized protein n=1 Tax=Eumeta variegata TaxID=151549 RepID=A0A4C1ULD7_EUMVA|nr:hypothetical protein EVAR_95766_1 [Eumeta japonica]